MDRPHDGPDRGTDVTGFGRPAGLDRAAVRLGARIGGVVADAGRARRRRRDHGVGPVAAPCVGVLARRRDAGDARRGGRDRRGGHRPRSPVRRLDLADGLHRGDESAASGMVRPRPRRAGHGGIRLVVAVGSAACAAARTRRPAQRCRGARGRARRRRGARFADADRASTQRPHARPADRPSRRAGPGDGRRIQRGHRRAGSRGVRALARPVDCACPAGRDQLCGAADPYRRLPRGRRSLRGAGRRHPRAGRQRAGPGRARTARFPGSPGPRRVRGRRSGAAELQSRA